MKYIWDTKWIKPYESLWSIVEKFKYVNVLTNKELRKLFDFSVSNRSSFQTSNTYYIYRKNSFNEKKVADFFSIKRDHFYALNIFQYNAIQSLIEKELYYCPECIKIGYHSYFHQLSFMKKCIFHDVDLLMAVDNLGKPCHYEISSSSNEAYKNGCSTEKVIINKYIDIPRASYLIVFTYGETNQSLRLHESYPKYEIIRFFNPINVRSKQINISERTKKIIENSLLNEINPDNLILEIKASECSISYNNLNEEVDEFKKENNIHDIYNNYVEEYLILKILDSYIKPINSTVMKESLRVLYNYRSFNKEESGITKNEFCSAASVIILAYYITNTKDVYDATQNLRKNLFRSKVVRNCDIIFEDLLKNKIDENEFANFLLYNIYIRIIHNTFIKIRQCIDSIDESEIKVNLDFDINNIPDYIVTKLKDTYFIYEIE